MSILGSDLPLGFPAEQLFQGPVADSLTHIGQIAKVRENLLWRSALFCDFELGKAFRRSAQGLPSAVGHGGQSVPQCGAVTGGLNRPLELFL